MSTAEGLIDSMIGQYTLVREIGRGAVGIVFEGVAADGAPAAIKVVVPPPLLPPAEAEALRLRFFREARAMASVRHPNVTRILDVGEQDGRLYLAMELLSGENLREIVARQGPLAPEAVVRVGLQLCDALEAVHHAGIVHRDVKPENLVILPDGTAKLTDFGVAWMENEATLTRTGGVIGSPAYMAPEQILGRTIDQRSDLFSVAATLYQAAADSLPFAGGTLMEMAHNVAYSDPRPLPADVPYAIARAIIRGLQKSPAARYGTATDFSQALRTALAAVPQREDPTATVTDLAARCSRHPGREAVGACQACGKPLCRHCARAEAPPFFCLIHQPVTLFGISTVRLEVMLAAAAFLLLLLCLSPLGYLAMRHYGPR